MSFNRDHINYGALKHPKQAPVLESEIEKLKIQIAEKEKLLKTVRLKVATVRKMEIGGDWILRRQLLREILNLLGG